MINKIEDLIRTLMAARGILSLYTETHSEFLSAMTKAYTLLEEIFEETDELTIGIIGDEFVYQSEIFTKLSTHLHDVIVYLKSIGIEKIVFHHGLEKDEVIHFLRFIMPGRSDNPEEMADYFTEHRIRNIVAGKIKSLVSSDGIADRLIQLPKDMSSLYDTSLHVVTQSIENVLDSGKLDSRNLKSTITNVMTNLLGEHQEFLKLSTVKRYDMATFMHILKVSILAMHFSSHLGFKNEDILDIGLAALFHDIGKIYISRRVIKKPDALTKAEFEMIASHTTIGAEIMLGYVESLGKLPVIVAYEHHVKFDGKGYPKLASYHTPHIASRITALCDVYDALSERRSYKDTFTPDVVYSIMKKGRGEHFDPELFDTFFQVVGVWPVGSIVKLSNEKIAIVRTVNHSNIHKPNVQIVNETEIINLDEKKDLYIVQSLNPRTDGEPYIQYI
jgi:putative nucleotidyltransferase with HDIG domain